MRITPSLTQLSVASIATEAVLAGLGVVSTAYFVRRLGTEEYGILAFVAVLAGQFSLLQLGVGPAAMRQVAECRARGDAAAYAATKYAVLAYGVATSILAAAVAAILVRWAFAGGVHLSGDVVAIGGSSIVPAIILLALQPLARAMAGVLQGQERSATLVGLRLAQGLGTISVTVTVVALGGHAPVVLWASVAMTTAALVVSAVTAGLVEWPQLPVRQIWRAGRTLVRAGLPFAAAAVLSGVLIDVEKLVIALSRSVEDFTYYTVPFGVTLRLSMIAGAFGVLLAPRVARMSAAGQLHSARHLTRQATELTVAALAMVVVPMLAITRELVHVWLGPAFAERAALPTRILLVALLVNASAYAASAALQARARPSTLTGLYLLELPVHLAVVFVLVDRWGLLGAACAWTVRVVLDTLAHWWLAHRTLDGPVAGARELGITITAAAGGIICALVQDSVPWPLRLAGSVIVVMGSLACLLSRDARALARSLFSVARSSGEVCGSVPSVNGAVDVITREGGAEPGRAVLSTASRGRTPS